MDPKTKIEADQITTSPAPHVSARHVIVLEFPKFKLQDRVRKTKGSSWQGRVVGFYSTSLTKNGYCVESEREPGSVQLYPESALELLP